MPGGLFELRKDSITGWWVAVVVDREFQKERFHRPAQHRGQSIDECANCQVAADDAGARCACSSRRRSSSPAPNARRTATRTARDPALGLLGDSGSWQTIVAPRGHHESLAETTPQIAFELLAHTRDVLQIAREQDKTEYLQVVQNFGRQAGALTDHLCSRLLRPAADPAPRRRGARRRGALRHSRGHLPVLSARARRGRRTQSGSSTRTLRASASRRTRVDRRSSCGSSRGTTTPTSARPRTRSSSARRTRCRASCGSCRPWADRRTT